MNLGAMSSGRGVQRELTEDGDGKADEACGDEVFNTAVTGRNLMKIKSACSKVIDRESKVLLELVSSIKKISAEFERGDADCEELDELGVFDDLEAATKAVSNAKETSKTIKKIKLADWETGKEQGKAVFAEIGESVERVQNTKEIVREFKAPRAKETEKLKNKDRHQSSKHMKFFLGNGVRKHLALMGSRMLHMADVENRKSDIVLEYVDVLDTSAPALFTAAQSPIKTVVEKLQVELDKKIANQTRILNSGQGKAARGLYERLGMKECTEAVAAMEGLEDMGPPNFDKELAPWVVTNRKFTMRVGASAYPFWGYATWVVALTEPLCVALFDVSVLQVSGSFHALERLPAVLEDKSVKKMC